jgi:hypothetical protein
LFKEKVGLEGNLGEGTPADGTAEVEGVDLYPSDTRVAEVVTTWESCRSVEQVETHCTLKGIYLYFH